jgi:thioredoxin reductase (NADPH)
MTETASVAAPIETECVIIGAGPCGLFAVFELGLLGLKCHIVDSLKHPGGQCAELYPDKPIYDIPALPICGAQELVDRLLQQIQPFGAGFHLGEEVTEVRRREDGRFDVATSKGTRFDAGAVVIAAGLGSFQPRRLAVEGWSSVEGASSTTGSHAPSSTTARTWSSAGAATARSTGRWSSAARRAR